MISYYTLEIFREIRSNVLNAHAQKHWEQAHKILYNYLLICFTIYERKQKK